MSRVLERGDKEPIDRSPLLHLNSEIEFMHHLRHDIQQFVSCHAHLTSS